MAYGGFSYTKDTDRVNLGPIHLEVKDRERVNYTPRGLRRTHVRVFSR
jgi:hypothetical protein